MIGLLSSSLRWLVGVLHSAYISLASKVGALYPTGAWAAYRGIWVTYFVVRSLK